MEPGQHPLRRDVQKPVPAAGGSTGDPSHTHHQSGLGQRGALSTPCIRRSWPRREVRAKASSNLKMLQRETHPLDSQSIPSSSPLPQTQPLFGGTWFVRERDGLQENQDVLA